VWGKVLATRTTKRAGAEAGTGAGAGAVAQRSRVMRFRFRTGSLPSRSPPPPSFGSVSLLPVNSIKLVSISFKILCSISALLTASAPASRKLMVLKLVPQTEWLPASLLELCLLPPATCPST